MAEQLNDMPGRSSFGNCTSLRQPLAVHVGSDHELQFLRGGGLHFIEARRRTRPPDPRRVAVPSGTALH